MKDILENFSCLSKPNLKLVNSFIHLRTKSTIKYAEEDIDLKYSIYRRVKLKNTIYPYINVKEGKKFDIGRKDLLKSNKVMQNKEIKVKEDINGKNIQKKIFEGDFSKYIKGGRERERGREKGFIYNKINFKSSSALNKNIMNKQYHNEDNLKDDEEFTKMFKSLNKQFHILNNRINNLNEIEKFVSNTIKSAHSKGNIKRDNNHTNPHIISCNKSLILNQKNQKKENIPNKNNNIKKSLILQSNIPQNFPSIQPNNPLTFKKIYQNT